MTENEASPPAERERLPSRRPLAERYAQFFTAAVKVAGLVIAIKEALIVDPPRDPVVFAIAAFMMAGAQGLDQFLSSFFGGGRK